MPDSSAVPQTGTAGTGETGGPVSVEVSFIDRTLDPDDPSPKILHYSGDVPLDLIYDLIEKWGLDA